MNCSDFLTLWNEHLDSRAAQSTALSEILDLHSSECESCRILASGLRDLSRSMPSPLVPPGLTDRVLNQWAADQASRRIPWSSIWQVAGSLAAAALVLLAFRLGTLDRGSDFPVVPRRSVFARPWTSALADATSATLALARETSAPAARVGQDVLTASRVADLGWPFGFESPAPPTEMIESVSKSVNSRMKPISGSARRAFSFLIAPTTNSTAPRPDPNDSGA